jgi:hypothetical protein
LGQAAIADIYADDNWSFAEFGEALGPFERETSCRLV